MTLIDTVPEGTRAVDSTLDRVAEPLAGKREWVGLGVLALACPVYAMGMTVLHLAVPMISAELRPTSSRLLWIIDVYGFMVAGLLVTMGTLGDRVGRRKPLMVGAAAFAAAFAVVSVVAAFAPSAELLVAVLRLRHIPAGELSSEH